MGAPEDESNRWPEHQATSASLDIHVHLDNTLDARPTDYRYREGSSRSRIHVQARLELLVPMPDATYPDPGRLTKSRITVILNIHINETCIAYDWAAANNASGFLQEPWTGATMLQDTLEIACSSVPHQIMSRVIPDELGGGGAVALIDGNASSHIILTKSRR